MGKQSIEVVGNFYYFECLKILLIKVDTKKFQWEW